MMDKQKIQYAVSAMQVALENGYTKVVMGTCTSQIACHVLEATVKVSPYYHIGRITY